jgi:DNA-binding transcriptional ArsR family regulator
MENRITNEEEIKSIKNQLNLISKRLDILLTLNERGPLNVTAISKLIEKQKSNVSNDLQELEEAGLVVQTEDKSGGHHILTTTLSYKGQNLMKTLTQKSNQTHLPTLSDDKHMEYSISLLNEEDKSLHEVGSSEIVMLSQGYVISPESKLFGYLEDNLEKITDKTVVVNLLEALRTIAINSPECLTTIREKLLMSIRTLALRVVEDGDYRVTGHALQVLTLAYEGDEHYEQLSEIYMTFLKRRSPMDGTARDLLVQAHPDKVLYIRRRLLDLCKEGSEEERQRALDNLSQLPVH